MSDLLSSTQIVLRDAGYVTRLISIDRNPIVCFEDEVLTGFACVFKDVLTLLEKWRHLETALLTRYAPNLRNAGDKAWNVYVLFLCDKYADSTQARQIAWVEENLERTRKIAAAGLSSREILIEAILPVLPLQFQPELRLEDVTERLLTRIRAITPQAADAVLNDALAPTEVVRLIGNQT